jgi:hypothetical protein
LKKFQTEKLQTKILDKEIIQDEFHLKRKRKRNENSTEELRNEDEFGEIQLQD